MSDEIEQEIVYEFDTCVPKDCYIKTLYGKISRKHIITRRILTLLMMCEITALIILDKSSARSVWIMLLIIMFIYGVFGRILLRINAIKRYEKIHAAKEDCFSYTFYNDCAKVKSPTVTVTLNYNTAEFLAENDKRLMIVFPFNNTITIEKSQCTEEQLAFFRSIVPEENYKKEAKKTGKKLFVGTALAVLYTALLAVMIAWSAGKNSRSYYPEYPQTTYTSFEACLGAGTVEDIVIINNKFIEYTFIGRGENERYYTVYSGDDIDRFTEKLDFLDVNWKFE
ncbi:MAG: hypothetical protein HDT43_03320 [Ruminococcaceae bacterium]|nr:hypothetical protein [Oscillospiraceae bacterium]